MFARGGNLLARSTQREAVGLRRQNQQSLAHFLKAQIGPIV